MSPEPPSHEQLNVYVQDEWKSPLRATTRIHIPGESYPQEIVTSGLPNKPAEYRVPKTSPYVEVEVLFEGYSEKKRIAVNERNWVFTIPKSVFDPANNPNKPKPETTSIFAGVDVENRKQDAGVGGSINPLGVLQQAIKAVPAVKYALGVAGIAAAIAIIKSLGLGYGVAFAGAIIMLVLMTALFLFNKLTQSSATSLRGPATVFTWFTLALYMAAAIGLTTSAFFSFPRPLGDLLGSVTSGSSNSPLAIAGTVINATNSSAVPRALVSTVGGQEIATTDDNGNFYLVLREAAPTVKVHVSAKGYGSLEWLIVPPAKDMTFPLAPVKVPPHPRQHGSTGPAGGSSVGSPPTSKTPDKQIGSADQYQREFSEAQGNEYHLIKFAEQAFASLNFEWTVKFLNQARLVSADKAWQQDYPLLAAATELSTNDHAQFVSILQEMLAEMRLNHSFLHDATRAGEIMQSLSYVRDYVQPESQKYIDNVVMQECLKIKKTL